MKCEYKIKGTNVPCRLTALFYVHQQVFPQILGDGTLERSPASRSVLTCGLHLQHAVNKLSSLPYKRTEHVSVKVLKKEKS